MIDGPPTEALRLRSADVLRARLLQLVVAGEEEWLEDFRDLMVAMAPYHDCAARIGLDPGSLFEQVSRECPPRLAGTVRTFGQRTDIAPSEWGFSVTTLVDGPAYERPHADRGNIRASEEWLSAEDEADS